MMRMLRDVGRRWSSAGVMLLAIGLVGTLALRSAAAGPLGPQQEDGRSFQAWLPLVAVGFAREDGIHPPAVAASATPSDTATPEPTATATPIVCGPLGTRLRVRTVDVSPEVVKVSANRGRTLFPVYHAPRLDGGALVGWADAAGMVHVTIVDSDDRRAAPDMTVSGDEIRGLVAHADGGVALLVVKGQVLSLVRFDASGGQLFKKDLIGLQGQSVVGSKWVDDWGHEARLLWAEDQYSVYSGHTQFFGAQGKHQGDLRWHFDGTGNRLEGRDKGWDWGCSHSLDLRLAHNGLRFGPVCLTDAYPAPPGIYFNHNEVRIRVEPSGDGRGYSAARLGGWVPLRDGFLLDFASPEGRPSTDVGLVKLYADGEIGVLHWLTDTAGVTEDAPHLARYGRDEFLASWMAGSDHLLSVVDEDGLIKEGPTKIEAMVGARDDFQTMPDGDVAWASGDNGSNLSLVRVDACGSPPVVTPVPTFTRPVPTTIPTAGPSPTPTITPTAGPGMCQNVLTNGNFEGGLAGWTFSGEVGASFSDHAGGKLGVELLGRNDVTGELRQQFTLPAGATSASLVYWWKMTSAEAVTSTKPYDMINVSASGATAAPGVLEVLSNLAGRSGWLPSAYAVPVGEASEVVFHATTNKRDATTFLLDDVQLIACTGSAGGFPVATIDPPSGPATTTFHASATGFAPNEAVNHWALEPATLLRFDLGPAAAYDSGVLVTSFQVRNTPGAWRWNAVGHTSLRPGAAGFSVTGAQR